MEKKFFTLLSCVCLFSCALAITVKNCGKSILPPNSFDRIVGGRKAEHGRHPWMISLLEDKRGEFKHVCGGAVLNENWIVTAAHCVDYYYSPFMYQVVAGLHKLSGMRDSTVQRIKVAKIVPHRDYNKVKKINDIALVKTAEPINITGSKGYINGICLPKTDEDPTGYAIVTGWGHFYEDGDNSDILREVVLPIVHRERCALSYYKIRITDTMMCAGITDKDSCQNDSGGPLVQTSPDGESTLIGVVAFGRGCGRENFPGIYTKVSNYRDWMKKIMSS